MLRVITPFSEIIFLNNSKQTGHSRPPHPHRILPPPRPVSCQSRTHPQISLLLLSERWGLQLGNLASFILV